MAVVMMNAVKTPRGAEEYHQKPPVPTLHVANAVLKLVRKLMREGFGVFAVFDRISRHPLKAARAGAIRNRTIASAEAQLDEIIRQSWPTGNKEQKKRLSDLLRLRKASAKISSAILAEVIDVLCENDVPFIVAPFEADWQLAYMANKGTIHAIATTDSDF